MLARDVMTPAVTTLAADHNIRQAAEIMVARQIGAIPVMGSDGALAGIITEGDLLRRLGPAKDRGGVSSQTDRTEALRSYIKTRSWCVKDVMTRNVVTSRPDSDIAEIADLMLINGIKHIPIVDQGHVLGIVARRNLLLALLSAPADRALAGDEAVLRAVRTRLYADLGFDPQHVGVTVSDGLITLTGEVESGVEQEAARVAAESIQGIAGVANKLTIAAKEQTETQAM